MAECDRLSLAGRRHWADVLLLLLLLGSTGRKSVAAALAPNLTLIDDNGATGKSQQNWTKRAATICKIK